MSVDEELAGYSDEGDLGRLASGSHALDKVGQGLVVPLGAAGAHVEHAAWSAPLAVDKIKRLI